VRYGPSPRQRRSPLAPSRGRVPRISAGSPRGIGAPRAGTPALPATVLGLFWWEDHILPTATPAPIPELLSADAPLTKEVARR
jgi:hypothetical protein